MPNDSNKKPSRSNGAKNRYVPKLNHLEVAERLERAAASGRGTKAQRTSALKSAQDLRKLDAYLKAKARPH
jgi:hypothetical protein